MKQLLDRIGTAFRILIGREPTWWGIQAEWAEIQVGAANLFRKHNALAARLAKEANELADARDEDCGCKDELPADAHPVSRKAALRHQVFGARYGRATPSPTPNGSSWDPSEGPRWVPDDELELEEPDE